MVEVVNMSKCRDFGKPGDFRCDRETKYGNPFIMYETKNRDLVCSLYEDYLDAITIPDNEHMVRTLLKLGGLSPVQVDTWMIRTNGYLDINELKDAKRLGCWCKNSDGKGPSCHCDALKRKVELLITPTIWKE